MPTHETAKYKAGDIVSYWTKDCPKYHLLILGLEQMNYKYFILEQGVYAKYPARGLERMTTLEA